MLGELSRDFPELESIHKGERVSKLRVCRGRFPDFFTVPE